MAAASACQGAISVESSIDFSRIKEGQQTKRSMKHAPAQMIYPQNTVRILPSNGLGTGRDRSKTPETP